MVVNNGRIHENAYRLKKNVVRALIELRVIFVYIVVSVLRMYHKTIRMGKIVIK